MITDRRTLCRVSVVLLLAGGAGVAVAAGVDDEERRGRIVEGPSNVRSFAPEESASASVDASELSFKDIFEELGDDASTWYQHVLTLSNPFFEGRAPGTKGLEYAADYLEHHFREFELTPAFRDADAEGEGLVSYRQPFEFSIPGKPVRVRDSTVEFDGDAMVDGEDYVVLGNSASANVSAPLAFVGYGIEDGPDGYSSFDEDTDLSGRIAILLRYEPLDEEGTSRWTRRRFSSHANIRGKMAAVAGRGAAGIIMVNPPGAVDGRDGLEPLERSSRYGRPLDIPAIQMTADAMNRVLATVDPDGDDLMAWRQRADTLDVRTADLSDDVELTIEAVVDHSTVMVENIGATLRGSGELANEWIVVGGHYDHVGYGYTGIRRNTRGQLHPGADDNASGTAMTLVLADRLRRQYERAGDDADLRSVMFVLFTAEEAGLWGSRHFVDEPPVSLDDITFMLNLDMVGRLRDNQLHLGGTGTADEFADLLPRHIESSGLTVASSPGGTGPSDHLNFFRAGVPVLFAFTGLHEWYHTPRDTGDTVNPIGAVRILDLLEPIVMDVATVRPRLTFNREASRGPRLTADRDEGAVDDQAGEAPPRPRDMGRRVTLGIMPSYTADLEEGVLVDQVFDGTSAAEAGIERGDVLLEWDGTLIADGQVLMNKLREHKPGDTVTITVRRDDDRIIDLETTLKASER